VILIFVALMINNHDMRCSWLSISVWIFFWNWIWILFCFFNDLCDNISFVIC